MVELKKFMILTLVVYIIISIPPNVRGNNFEDNTNDINSTLNGTIIDSYYKAPLENINIKLDDEITIKTNEEGMYSFTNVTPGTYYLEITHREYRTYRKEITIYPGLNYLNTTLEHEFVPSDDFFQSSFFIVILIVGLIVIGIIIVTYKLRKV